MREANQDVSEKSIIARRSQMRFSIPTALRLRGPAAMLFAGTSALRIDDMINVCWI